MVEPDGGKSFAVRGLSVLPPPRVLAAARVLAGLSQEELARRVGVDRSIIKRYEAGRSEARASTLERVVEVLLEDGVVVLPQTESHSVAIAYIRREEELEPSTLSRQQAPPDNNSI